MSYSIEKITVDGITFVGCRLSADSNTETAAVGVAEATVTAAASGATLTITAVASPTGSQNVGPSRAGIDYRPLGRLERCVICGAVFHRRELSRVSRAGPDGHAYTGWVCREDYDEVIPTRGRGTHISSRRSSMIGSL